jgi:hypothetical protein
MVLMCKRIYYFFQILPCLAFYKACLFFNTHRCYGHNTLLQPSYQALRKPYSKPATMIQIEPIAPHWPVDLTTKH